MKSNHPAGYGEKGVAGNSGIVIDANNTNGYYNSYQPNLSESAKKADMVGYGDNYNPNQNNYMPGGPDAMTSKVAPQYQSNVPYGQNPSLAPPQNANPYPTHSPADVQRAVRGESKWKGTNCLD